jgi:hypothetical protein
MAVDRRYQVFVSSTYLDLIDERREVMQALLELDCIPSGMELFQAADEDQWSLIKRVIDDCDYYMVIVGGRYGSVGADGLSFTEMEYRYATEIGKPVIAFLHDKPEEITAGKTETAEDGRQRLTDFRDLCQQKVVKFWNTPEGLGSVVSRSIIKLIKDRPAVGWIRGDIATSDEANLEILKLRKNIDDLQQKVPSATLSPPEGSKNLIGVFDKFPVRAISGFRSAENKYRTDSIRFLYDIKLNDLLKFVGPYALEEITERDIQRKVNDFFVQEFASKIQDNQKYKDRTLLSVEAEDSCFQEIKIQLIALGIIVKGDKRRPPSDSNVYWKLTPFGETMLMSSLAKKKFDFSNSSEEPASEKNDGAENS